MEALTAHFGNAKSLIRVTGLSGLGKTRLVYEAAAKVDQEDNPSIVYYDAAGGEDQDLLNWLRSTISVGRKGTLVVDNCPVALHYSLQEEVQRSDSNVCLITIDYSPENTAGGTMIRVERFADEFIEAMLAPVYKSRIDEYELKKIVRFAQGFPRLAVMLADARLAEEANMGTLDDDVIARRLLWGNEPISPINEKILQGCALFEHFGFEGDVSDQFKFIATSVVGVKEEDFHDCVQDYTVRGLIDRRGRYAQLVPKPLAIRLAAQWWRRASRERQLKVISTLPEVMEESFCAQIARLDFLPEVKTFTEDLCGPQGPFGQAEVILSRRGSLLFRSLVEVNPEATAALIERVLVPLPVQDVSHIRGEARRNLVWALEKLSVRRETFSRAANCLLQLSVTENESWSNNATGIFCQLFRVYLSGTAATPNERLEFSRKILVQDSESHAMILVRALGNAFDLRGGIRTVGAEYQGSAPAIEEWRPTIWQDVFDYLDAIGILLLSIFDKFPNLRLEIKRVVGVSIRTLIANGRIELLERLIEHITATSGQDWYEALESIKDSLAYDTKNIPEEGKQALERWHLLLSGRDATLEERLRILVVHPPFEHREAENGDLVDVARENAQNLARSLATNVSEIVPLIHVLLTSGEQRQTFAFGEAFAIATDGLDELIKAVVAEMEITRSKSVSFLGGLLRGQYLCSQLKWERTLRWLEHLGYFNEFYPELIRTGEITSYHLEKVIEFVHAGRTPLINLRTFCYGNPLGDLDPSVCISFVSQILRVDEDIAPWLSLDILFMYCHGNLEKRRACLGTFRTIVFACPMDDSGNIRDHHQWTTVAKWLVKEFDSQTIKLLTEKICEIVADSNIDSRVLDEVKPVLEQALQINLGASWPPLRNAITASEGITYLRFLWLFEPKRVFSIDHRGGLITLIPTETLLQWCKDAPNVAPYFIARTLEIFVTQDDQLRLNDLVVTLLMKFGDEENRLSSELDANMGTRSWTGSLIPLLQKDKAALEPLTTHPAKVVSAWAIDRIGMIDAEIAREKIDEDERDLRMR
jgi:hypothetical protein